MTERQAGRWKQIRARGLPIYCATQAAWMGALLCLVVTLQTWLIFGRLPDLKSAWPIVALLSVVWGFFAIGLWHKKEYAYLLHMSVDRDLSPAVGRR